MIFPAKIFMKVTVVCSNGKVGKLVVAESLAAGFDVTGFARGENKSGAKNFVQKMYTDFFVCTCRCRVWNDILIKKMLHVQQKIY